MNLFVGIDLGEAGNHTAVAAVDRQPLAKPIHRRKFRYALRFLEEYELGIHYPDQVARLAETLRKPAFKGSKVGADYTGVGRPVVQLLQLQRCPVSLFPVLITSGANATFDREHREYHVPKRELVAVVQVLLQTELIAWHPKLAAAKKLEKQLGQFKVRLTKAKNETFGAEGRDQDDLVLAVAIACWLGEHVGTADASGISSGSSSDSGDQSGSVIDDAPKGVFHS